jgi:putative FmdB family regulatory protein
MPLYEYECDKCGHRFEVIQKFSDPLVDSCPKCGSAVRKLMSSPAIQFKGSGWYITDYAKKDSTAATKAGNAKDGSTAGADAAPAASDSAAPAATPAAATTPAKSE